MTAGHVYVLKLDNETVKVGQTEDPTRRLGAHKRHARSLGVTVIERWVSPPHAEFLENERALKAIAAELGGKPRSPEVFWRVNFADVVIRAQALKYTLPEGYEPADRGRCWEVLKDDLAWRLERLGELLPGLVPPADSAVGCYADALKDALKWMAQLETDCPEPAGT